jgi:hypothetical protein
MVERDVRIDDLLLYALVVTNPAVDKEFPA